MGTSKEKVREKLIKTISGMGYPEEFGLVINEASLIFHKAMGFKEVGTQFVRDGQVKVTLQAAEIKDI